MIFHQTITVLAVLSLLIAQCAGEEPPQVVERDHGPLLIRSYRAATVPPVNLTNSDRLHSLIRAERKEVRLAERGNAILDASRARPH